MSKDVSILVFRKLTPGNERMRDLAGLELHKASRPPAGRGYTDRRDMTEFSLFNPVREDTTSYYIAWYLLRPGNTTWLIYCIITVHVRSCRYSLDIRGQPAKNPVRPKIHDDDKYVPVLLDQIVDVQQGGRY